MSDYVYANNSGIVRNPHSGVGSSTMAPNDIWPADDPFVRDRPELFSATPVLVHASEGKQVFAPTPVVVVVVKRGKAAASVDF